MASDSSNLTLLNDTVIQEVESWFGLESLDGHTDLHVLHGGTLIAVKDRDEVLDPYVRQNAIGEEFIQMDDSARPR
ncbi:hypothetical protein AVEN_67568-1 [Araneus ventricosus]|uniref:Uncharacterized protein n=1 Tax=Araneus ventricosus TaxID=182803 RepID=A0A4Y2TVA2_ARAVE|nr:hypothetical protein AVEN_67568-1 [Araneus ventricosus]